MPNLGSQSVGAPVISPVLAHGGSNVVAEKRDFQIMQPNERTTTAGNRVGNKILLSIPDKEYALLRPHLEFLSMPHHLSLYEPGQPPRVCAFSEYRYGVSCNCEIGR